MKGLVMGVVVLVALLFVAGPDSQDSRIAQEIWDFGHVVLFAALAVLAVRLPVLRGWSVLRLLLLWALAAPLLGLAIEWIQLVVGRDFDYQDVLADTVGAFCGLALHLGCQPARRLAVRAGSFIGLVVMLLFALRLIGVALFDMYYMREEFPVLADFETPFELSRWDKKRAVLEISTEHVRFGEKALRVNFMAGEYPAITFFDFPGDWRDFKSVRFNVYSTLAYPMPMELKIYDAHHAATGNEYADRFNRELVIHPGWNDIEVRMDDVERAPQRGMDLQHIVGVSLFIEKLDQPAVFYVDALRLSSN